MTNRLVDSVEKAHLKSDIPQFTVGDTVDVATRIVEGDKERLQVFSGTVIMRRGRGINETFADGLLEYPQFTKPREFRGMEVPEVLLSGNHGAIAAWRDEQRKIRTKERRPDLWRAYETKRDTTNAG